MSGALEVRPAGPADVDYLVEAVARLIAELRGVPYEPPPASIDDRRRQAAYSLVTARLPGIALIAVDALEDRLGLITASYQSAVRTGGQYALIQELWVMASMRGRGVGSALIAALCRSARAAGCRTVEVGIPHYDSPAFARTYPRYAQWGFKDLGPRMRKDLHDPDGR